MVFSYYCSIICSETITLCISNEYNIISFGKSLYKAHGHEQENIYIPKQIISLSNIKMIDCGLKHTICLNYDGEVYSFGNNDYNQLGIGYHTVKQTYIPTKIELPSCKQISCGEKFTICLTDDDKLYSFGDNNKGQLGLGTNNYDSPQLIPDLNNIEYIVCGGTYSICKTFDTEFYSWGSNFNGKLGQGHFNYNSINKPIQCFNWPDNIISIKCGKYHTLLLTSEGQVYSFGFNSTGQLGLNDRTIQKINTPTLIKDIPEIQRIECGYSHSMCIDINNNLWLFGFNSYGQLGLGDTENKFKPIMLSKLSNIIDISSKGYHTFVKTIDNKIFAFGNNKYSQLGIKTSEKKQITPIQVFKDNEDIWCTTIRKSKAKSARK